MNREDLAIVVLMALAVAHLAILGWWVVDDAAISFAYARSLATGHGLAPYVGGEQVEGYSNPTWVALLAAAHLLGVDPFTGAKALSFALVAATVPGVHALARRVDPLAGVPAAALFVANTQVAVFGAAGLENPLLWFLLTLGLWRFAREVEGGGPPVSGLVFAVLGASRPEGLLYAAALAPWVLYGFGARRTAGWVVALGVPTVGYQAARYAWFAWPFPMTYYAKVRSDVETLVRWQGGGWRYLRGWAFDPVRAWVGPLVLVGALGVSPRVIAVLGAVAAAAVLPEGLRWLGPPSALLLLGLSAGLAVPIAGEEGWRVRGPCWTTAVAAGWFAIRAGGDWMSGWRWLAIAAVPLAVLAAVGLTALARRLPRAAGIASVTVVWVVFAALNASSTVGFRVDPETSAFVIGGRVRATRDLLARLHVRERAVCMTFDLGGYLWWSGMELVDTMGLIDVPVAMSKERGAAFWDEYLLERRPHVLLQVGMAAGTDLAAGRVLGEQYLEVGRTMRVRRDLVFVPEWTGEDLPVPLGDGVVLEGLEIRPAEVGDTLRVRIGLRSTAGAGFAPELVVAGPDGTAAAAWPLDPAYGMLSPPSWRPDEVFDGRYALALPPDVPLGPLRVGLRAAAGGEVTWLEDRVVRVDPETARAALRTERARVLAAATGGRCEEADRADADDPELRRARAACWVARTDGDVVTRVLRARRIDPQVPGVDVLVAPIVEARLADGLRARDAGDVDAAYAAFSDVLRLDPGRPRVRRYAEEARAVRLDRVALPEPHHD